MLSQMGHESQSYSMRPSNAANTQGNSEAFYTYECKTHVCFSLGVEDSVQQFRESQQLHTLFLLDILQVNKHLQTIVV